MEAWLARRYANLKVRGSKPGLDRLRNAYFHGVKTRLSTLETGDVPRGSDSVVRVYGCNWDYD